MKKCFLFSFIKEIATDNSDACLRNILVLFFPYKDIMESQGNIQVQLREYFFRNTLPDKLIVICFDFNKDAAVALFSSGSDIYSYIPKFSPGKDGQNLHVTSMAENGKLIPIIGSQIEDSFMDELYRRGMVKIFTENGGQIISQSAHHFVFPSGKHCDRFLRTGNVLLHGTEILFIASGLIKYFGTRKSNTIYCDTSSINSLAYAYASLLRDLNQDFTTPHIESFGSYELFEKSTFRAERNSLFLISSSTSGSILRRMSTENKSKNILLDNICIIYGLYVESEFQSRILCDLTKDPKINPKGLDPFVSFNVKKGERCKLCENGSHPLKVEGDVFLLEKPFVKGHQITTYDSPAFLKDFSNYYRPDIEESSLIRCFYKESSPSKKYEIYIDIDHILNQWATRKQEGGNYKPIYTRLEKFILKNIPASLKYMIVLPDKASLTLANIISEVITTNGLAFETTNILTIEEFDKIDKEKKGTIAVISSSIVSGRNLLYLSRELREYEKTYQKMYFTFLNRPQRLDHNLFLESNIAMGEFGKLTNRIVNVESILCNQEATSTPWHQELDFLKSLQEFCEEEDNYRETYDYCRKRIEELNESADKIGLENNLFFPSYAGNLLKINNGFVFAPAKENFTHTATQSEVYFIISCILNEMRIKGKLIQSEYVRNIIEPGNFVRYNDAIIQACILRASTKEELRYDISDEMGIQIEAILGDMINHLGDKHSEGILEFFYAIAIKKLRMADDFLRDCLTLLEEQSIYQAKDSILKGIVGYIRKFTLPEKRIVDKFKDSEEKIQKISAPI